MADIFISYASEDRDRAQVLAETLERQGWSVWWDRTILPGKTFDQVISAALDSARCVVVLWTRQSVNSDWVREEADAGLRRKVLVPVLLDDVEIPLGFRRVQAASLFDWQGAADHSELAKLFRSIAEHAGADRAPAPPKDIDQKHGLSKRWWAAGGAVLAVAAVAVIGWWSSSTSVPSVIGKPIEEAKASIAILNLAIGKVEETADEGAQGVVVRQRPDPGTKAKAGSAVDLVVGVQGPVPKVRVPDVRNQSVAKARPILQAARLVLGETETVDSLEAPEGSVLDQNPKPGEHVPVQSEVALSIAKPAVVVPNLVRLKVSEARARLEKFGLQLLRVEVEGHDVSDESIVVTQLPSDGARVEPGTVVQVVASKSQRPTDPTVGESKPSPAPGGDKLLTRPPIPAAKIFEAAFACQPGYVRRESRPGDLVCVKPEVRDQVAMDNKAAGERRQPGGGAYGPNTCRSGLVWREAYEGDLVCVDPKQRDQAKADNAQAANRVAK
ncbi:MAG: PASTA domain-containing protein [Burkholderiales bacterium]